MKKFKAIIKSGISLAKRLIRSLNSIKRLKPYIDMNTKPKNVTTKTWGNYLVSESHYHTTNILSKYLLVKETNKQKKTYMINIRFTNIGNH